MDRRVSGGLMLVLALVAVLVVPKILNPSRLSGTASIAPPPPPPVVGDCLREKVSGYEFSSSGELVSAGPSRVAPCSESHGSEIILVDAALTTPAPNAANGVRPFDAVMERCWSRVQDLWHLGDPPPDNWWPRVEVDIGIIGPDRWQAAAGQRWSACTLGKLNEELTGRVADLAPTGGVPAAFGSCSTIVHGNELGGTWGQGCAVPHNHEDFGYRMLQVGSSLTQDELIRSCVDLLTRAIGRTGLATEPELIVETEAYFWNSSGEGSATTLPLPSDADGGSASCSVHTVGDRQLTGSLRQIGDAPLPWAP